MPVDRKTLGSLQRGHLIMEEFFRRDFPASYPEVQEDVQAVLIALCAGGNQDSSPRAMELLAKAVLLGALIGVMDTERRLYEYDVESPLSCDHQDTPGAGDEDL